MTNLKISFYCFLLTGIVFSSCTPKASTDTLLEPFIGTFFFTMANDGEISVTEICTMGTAENLQIEKVGDVFFLYWRNIKTISYVVQSARKNGDEIIIEALNQDVDGSNPDPKIFRLMGGNYLTLTVDANEYTLVAADETNKFVYHSCAEAMEREGDSDSPDDFVMPDIDISTKEGQALAELFKFLDPTIKHQLYFLEGETIALEKPGPGAFPVKETIANEDELTVFINVNLKNYSPRLLAQRRAEGFIFYEDLPFYCEPTKAGIFIKVSTDDASKISSAKISWVDHEQNSEPITIFTLYYNWDENQNLDLSKIDISDCDA